MNFGLRTGRKALKQQQQPTYYLAPNFTTRPFPNGPLELGTLVEDTQQFQPLNQGANRIQIPPGQRYSDTKEDIYVGLKHSRNGEAGFLAKVFEGCLGAEASLKGEKNEEDVYTIQKLETSYFYPQVSYIKKCLRLSDIEDYLEMGDYKEPVYLITGLKIAWGATISSSAHSGYAGKGEAGLTIPGPIDVDVKAKAEVGKGSTASSSFRKPADFVLGIQVMKIYHIRKIFGSGRVLATSRLTKGAVLVDDEEPEDEDEGEDSFIVAALDDAEIESLTPLYEKDSQGQDEE
ncbi:hypothetical protein F5B19DRAFT_467984 [Rostrohypoxylon terebratum]|nr:hypothetical protein F5B19DRAFT_467984 [Rostrohypoxylon terebratum]